MSFFNCSDLFPFPLAPAKRVLKGWHLLDQKNDKNAVLEQGNPQNLSLIKDAKESVF